jgi:nucleoside-diphosphate-sugar epimerase
MNATTRTVLVTGGSGYFGSLLVARLLERGDDVRVFDRNPPETMRARFMPGDIRDAAAVRRACAGVDSIYHCVAQVPLARDRELFWSVNRDGTQNLLRAAFEENVRKVIYISSSAVFGVPKQLPITEETPPAPVEAYGMAKFAGEVLCQEAADAGLDVTIVRPRTILGHGRLGIMQLLFEWIREGRNVFVLGRGDNRYQFVHAEDLADACLLAADRPGPAIYNVGAETFGTMRETLESLIDHAGTGSRVRSLPRRLATMAMRLTGTLGLAPLAPYHWLVYGRDVYFDVSRAKRELGWRPRWGYADMFAQSYQWYLGNRQQVFTVRNQSAHRSPVKEGALKMLRWF